MLKRAQYIQIQKLAKGRPWMWLSCSIRVSSRAGKAEQYFSALNTCKWERAVSREEGRQINSM